QAELDPMLQNPLDKVTLAQMTDQAFRTNEPHRAVEHLIHILDVQGVPRFFSPLDRTLLKGFQSFGGYMPGVALPLVKEHMQKETANVILPGEKELLTGHLAERNREGVRMNVNFLGEAILSEAEAERRLQQYLQGLQWPEIDLQSYLPDSYETMLQLQEWARRRVANGGGRIMIRIVKGANMEMERVEASIHGWPQAPFKSKIETDANYKRMLEESLKPEN